MSWCNPDLLHYQHEGDTELSLDVQTFFGYDGLIYAKQRRKERLDQKIEALENELARLKKLRRELGS